MTHPSNPAGRLHSILRTAANGDPKTRVLDVWANVFGISESDDLIVTRHLLALNETVDEVERLIRANPSLNHAKYLAGFSEVRVALRPIYLQSNRGIISNNVTSEVLTRLEFCDEELYRYYSEEVLSQEDLADISEATNVLFELVASTVHDATLRIVLLEGLEKIRIALSLYRIHGAKGLKTSLQNLLGLVFTEQAAIKIEKVKSADVIAKLGALLEKLDSFSAKALRVHKVLTKPVRFLIDWLAKDSSDIPNDSPVDQFSIGVEI